jgi:hypothetical protein
MACRVTSCGCCGHSGASIHTRTSCSCTDIISEHDAEFWEDYEGEVIAIPLSEFERL